MIHLRYIVLFAYVGKVSCSQFCSSLTQNGWFNVDPGNSICFKYYNETSTWWDAKRSCEQEGLFLARLDSESIEEFIEEKRANDWMKPFFWIGGINEKDSGWKWTNGDKMEFTNFDLVTGTINRILSFFKKSTYCAMYGYEYWFKKSCEELAPYLCQSERNTTLTKAESEVLFPRTRHSDSSTKFCRPISRARLMSWDSPRTDCFVYFEDRLTWWDANKTCHQQNMTLVTISGYGIHIWLKNVLSYTIIGFWIGAINKDDTGWKWGNGEEMIYRHFENFAINWDRVSQTTLCGVFQTFGWYKRSCDRLYPFVCHFTQNSISTLQEKSEIQELTTLPGGMSLVPKAAEQHKHGVFKVKKTVRGLLNPKLMDSGMRSIFDSSVIHCCRHCSHENGCEFVNYCDTAGSCVLYDNDSAFSGEVTSEPGCSVYVDIKKVR